MSEAMAGPAPDTAASPMRLPGTVPGPVTSSVLASTREMVVLATVVTQGALPGDPTVPASGPSLPAEVATKMPALRALRNASESGSPQGLSGPPPME